jgi:hypothetical protein
MSHAASSTAGTVAKEGSSTSVRVGSEIVWEGVPTEPLDGGWPEGMCLSGFELILYICLIFIYGVVGFCF